ncbi:MAG TPA: MmgE/PrpD family protein [Chloroflexota bacterium]|jgi:2-methylcitrate dehydratase PrpD
MSEQAIRGATDPGAALAAYAASVAFERLPGEVVSVLKRMLLDTLGTTLAGSALGTGCAELLAVVREAGGTAESTLIGFDARVPAAQAALANGATGHALNYEDVYPGGGHLGVVTIPAALALAERQGGVSGREFLAALAAGAEIAARLQVAVRRRDDGTSEAKPQPTQMLGYFSAAASAGRVLGLGPDAMLSALGLALMQASGNRQVVVEGPPAKAIYASFPNQGGVLSALLSAKGLRADCAIFAGEAGFFPTFYQGRYDPAPLTERLGEEYYLAQVGFKPWPTTNRAHPFIEAALELAASHPLDAIAEVHVVGGNHIRTFCEPLATRQRPHTSVEAEDSIFFGVAKALVNRQVTLADFQPDGLRQPETVALGPRMRYSLDAALGHAGIVEVTTAAGERYRCRIDKPLGDPAKPLSDAQLVAKFRDCARHAVTPLAPPTLDAVIALVEHLEDAPDVAALTALLRGG